MMQLTVASSELTMIFSNFIDYNITVTYELMILNATNTDLQGVSTAVTVDNTGTSETLSIS